MLADPLAAPGPTPDHNREAEPAERAAEPSAPAEKTIEPQPPTEPASKSVADGPAPDIYLLEAGDRLKVFVYGRQDLSSEYRVSDQGRVRIPTLGSFEAIGRTPAQLEDAIGEAFERLLQRPGSVSVDVIERRPVYVTGLVAKPGAYRFSAGMTVIHATALAGGTSANASAPWLPTEALRESARARTSEEELKHLLANQARLIAEREGTEVIEIPPRLIDLVGPDLAAEYIHEERGVLKRQREILERQETSLNTAISEAKTEIAAYEKELAKIQEQRSLREASLSTLQTLSQKGLTTQQRLMDSQILLASADRDAQYAIANISRSRQSLDRAERDLAMLALDRKMAIDKELHTIDEQIAKARVTIESAGKVVGQIAGLPAQVVAREREPQFKFEIMRKGGDGELHPVVATETTKLLPGDVLRVTALSVKS
jgi:polysaccharide export outer membrane protein